MTNRVDLDEGTRLHGNAWMSHAHAEVRNEWMRDNFPAHRDETLALRESVAKVREEARRLRNHGSPGLRAIAVVLDESLEGLPE